MTNPIKLWLAVLALFTLCAASPLPAQQEGQYVPGQSNLSADDAREPGTNLLAINDTSSRTPSDLGSADDSLITSAEPQPSNSAQSKSSSDDNNWHINVVPYLWFPGVHGTVGAAGKQISVHASPGDLLSNFKFGLMGAVEFSYKRFVIPVDMMWVRLEDDHPIPLEVVTSAKFTANEFFLTPKIGYRFIDEEKIKITGLTGFRYWHLGESVKFNPVALSYSASQNWVDPLVGGNIELAPAPKVVVTILGDVGGWGTGSQLEYQFAGLLGFKIKPKWTLQAGYRYLSVDYRNGGFLFDVITSGAVFGVTIELK